MDRSQDSITSWFVRRRLGAAARADGKRADGKAGKHSKQQRKEEQALAKTKEDGKARPSEGKPVKPQAPEAATAKEASQRKQEAAPAKPPPQPAQQQQIQEPSKQPGKQQPGSAAGEEKRHHPKGLVAAAAAVADRAKEAVKTAAAAADAEEERQKQQQQPQRAAEPAPSTTAQAAPGADAGREREGEHGPSGGARAQKAAAPPAPAADKPPAPQRQGGQQAETAKQEDEDEEAEDRPRVVAYSDSDSDVESHIQRVKHHLLPSKEEEEAAAAAATAAETAAAEAAALAAAAAARLRAPLRRLGRAGAGAAGLVGHAAAQHATPGLAVRAGSLLALGRAAPRAATALGALGVAVPLVGAAAGRCGLDLAAALPAPLLTAGQELGQFGKAAAAIAASRLLQAGLRNRRRAAQRRRAQRAAAAAAAKAAARAEARREDAAADPEPPAVGLLRHKSSVNLAALAAFSDLGAAIEQRQPQTAAEWAQVYDSELAEMRRMLQENKVELPPDRFDGTNAELLRFCKACGLLEAKTPEQRAIAVEAAFSRVVHTAEWVARQRFLTPRELRRWDRLVAWKAHDASGRPILLARLGRAQQLVKPERYDELANALLTLVHRGLTGQLSNAAGAAEQMVVVLDCRGGSSMGLTRHMGLLKRLAITLNEHYPDRLFKLHLLELPLLLRWALHAVMPLLHPHTRSKVVLSSITDPDLAVTVAFLTKRRSSAAKATLRRTMSNCSFLSSGDSTPALLSPQTSLGQAVHGLAAATPEGAAAAACGPEQRHRLSMGHAASAEACIEAPPPALPAPLSHAQAQGREQLGEEDVPHTPPPTLKGPQSPREPGLRARRQLQHRPQQAQQQQQQSHEQGRHHPHHPAHHPAPHHQRPEHHSQHSQHSQHALRPALAHEPDRQQQQHVHLEQGRLGQASQELQQLDALQAAAASPPSRRPAPGGGPPQVARPSPFDSIRRSLEEPVAACASEQQLAGSVPVAAASSQPVLPDAGALQRAVTSAAAGPSSHAVPWSPGMHSPAGSLSRASSLGEELVPAARAKAAADAARTWEQGQAAASSGSGGAWAPPPAQHGTLLRTESSAASSTGPAAGGAGQCSGRAAAAGSTLAGLSAALAAMLPSRRGSGLPPSRQQRGQLALPRTSSNLSLGSPGSCGGSPRTPTSARRLDGLTDLPLRPLGRSRPGRGRGLTPRKSSLRRSQSADCFGAASGRGLGSHPLRRQSSVSWAEELEMVKEIAPQEGSPAAGSASPLRARLAATNRQHLLLTTFFLMLMVAVLAQRLGLSSML